MADPVDAEAFSTLWLLYTEKFGAPPLRHAIATTCAPQTANDILCFAGAEEGIYVAMLALLAKGDHAIVVTPNCQAVETVPQSLCEVRGMALDPDQSWTLDIDRVAHHPTGTILEYDRLMALVTLCRKHGIWLYGDGV